MKYPPSLTCILREVSWLPNVLASSLLAVVWSAVATLGGWCLHWIWPNQFTTAYPDLSDGLYLLIHLIANSALVSNGLVEYLAKFGLGLWNGNANKRTPTPPVVGAGGETDPLIPSSQNQG